MMQLTRFQKTMVKLTTLEIDFSKTLLKISHNILESYSKHIYLKFGNNFGSFPIETLACCI